ncbi:MobQ family relaxase [Roseobacter sp. A03A-229]
MASYHLSVKTIKRSAGRSATAAAAYRVGERIECQREGRVHDYTRKQGIEETFILTPKDAPEWALDRSKLWNEVEASETRRNSVTAREWELALPSEISAEDRSQITRDFAEELVSRYGVAVDVAIHAPNREGDQRNHHAHVLTSTRKLEPEGFTAKTRVLDSAKTGGVEIEQMRGVWADLQNRALERVGEVERVDHRSLEAQREAALERGDQLSAEELDRDPELKLGPAANSMERREKAAAAREGREYVTVTERGAVVHAARQARVRSASYASDWTLLGTPTRLSAMRGRGLCLPVSRRSGRRLRKSKARSLGRRTCASAWRRSSDGQRIGRTRRCRKAATMHGSGSKRSWRRAPVEMVKQRFINWKGTAIQSSARGPINQISNRP